MVKPLTQTHLSGEPSLTALSLSLFLSSCLPFSFPSFFFSIPDLHISIFSSLLAEELYREYARAINRAVDDVRSFTAVLQSDETRSIFDRAAASRRERPDGIRPWLVTDHPDWTDGRPKKKEDNGDDEKYEQQGMMRANEDTLGDDDIRTILMLFTPENQWDNAAQQILQRWKDRHSWKKAKKIRAEFDSETGKIEV